MCLAPLQTQAPPLIMVMADGGVQAISTAFSKDMAGFPEGRTVYTGENTS